MLYIFDREENLLKILNNNSYEDFEHIVKLNSERSLSFTSSEAEHLNRYNKVGFFNEDDQFQLFIIDDISELKEEFETKTSVSCLHDFYSLNNNIIDDKRVINGNATQALTKALERTSYNVGTVQDFENKDINFYFISSLKALNEIVKTYDCEFDVRVEINKKSGKIDGKFIDLKHRLGQDTGLRFTFDTNLNFVEKNTITEGHFNVLFGRGKSLETEGGGFSRKLTFENVEWTASVNPVAKPLGQKYVEDLESILKFGRLEGIYENDEIEDPNILLQETYNKLQISKVPKLNYSLSVEDLSKFNGFEHYKYKLGDTILVEDEELTIEARIIEIRETNEENFITLGNFLNGLIDDGLDEEIGNIKDKVDNIVNNNNGNQDTSFPDTLPAVPTLAAHGLFSTISIEWTFEAQSYYTYELFASKIKDFNPDTSNRIFQGKASSYLHQAKPGETWYYRCRGKNTHNKYTPFSAQVEASTAKIADGTEWFENAAIGHALIGSLDADKIVTGTLKGHYIDAKNLSVTDGNGEKTLNIDSYGNIEMNVNSLKIVNKSVVTEDMIDKLNYEVLVDVTGGTSFQDDKPKIAKVIVKYKGADVTSTLPQHRFKWRRESSDMEGDLNWNDEHIHMKQITIQRDEVRGKGIIKFKVEFFDETGALLASSK